MISLLCPTRCRPDQMTRLAESAFSLADNPRDVELYFAIDSDDSASLVRAWDLIERYNVRWKSTERLPLSHYWNFVANTARGEILGMMADDVVFRTKGWDAIVAGEFERWPDRIVFVYGCDGLQDERLGTHGFIHRRWYETVGRFTAPYFTGDYVDTWLNDVARALSRTSFLADLLIEHLHPAANKAEMDVTYREKYERMSVDNNAQIYEEKAAERQNEVALLREVLGT